MTKMIDIVVSNELPLEYYTGIRNVLVLYMVNGYVMSILYARTMTTQSMCRFVHKRKVVPKKLSSFFDFFFFRFVYDSMLGSV